MKYKNEILNNANKINIIVGKNNIIYKGWEINYINVNKINDYNPCIIITSYPIQSFDLKYVSIKYSSIGYYHNYEDFLAIEALQKCYTIHFIDVLRDWDEKKIDEIIDELRAIHKI